MIADSQPSRYLRPLSTGLLTLATATLVSCLAPKPAPPPLAVKKAERPLFNWDVEKAAKMQGKPSIVIDLTTQRATYFRNSKELGWTTVATGTSKHPTPTGRFEVLEKTVDKVSNLYGKMLDAQGKVVVSDAKMGETPIPEGGKFEGAKMQYFMRFTYDGVGMHIGPIPHPGRPASHGCVRTPRVMAERYFEITPLGTPVTIMESAAADEPNTKSATGSNNSQPKNAGFKLRNLLHLSPALFKSSTPTTPLAAVPKGQVVP
jgi:hypothetical protein